ncbi:hypothetical protein [Acidocella facilis]|uniref:hypothetical protein n=1 Tax=Acidocella facilis TaxID=525 RepID=UPI001F18EA3E|nr:hypothetical protein [Acidocella facilis]
MNEKTEILARASEVTSAAVLNVERLTAATQRLDAENRQYGELLAAAAAGEAVEDRDFEAAEAALASAAQKARRLAMIGQIQLAVLPAAIQAAQDGAEDRE